MTIQNLVNIKCLSQILCIPTMSPHCTPSIIPVSIPACSNIEEVMGNGEGGHLVQLGKAPADNAPPLPACPSSTAVTLQGHEVKITILLKFEGFRAIWWAQTLIIWCPLFTMVTLQNCRSIAPLV
jgi:hypothetical protein